jgi:hypothetical protein
MTQLRKCSFSRSALATLAVMGFLLVSGGVALADDASDCTKAAGSSLGDPSSNLHRTCENPANPACSGQGAQTAGTASQAQQIGAAQAAQCANSGNVNQGVQNTSQCMHDSCNGAIAQCINSCQAAVTKLQQQISANPSLQPTLQPQLTDMQNKLQICKDPQWVTDVNNFASAATQAAANQGTTTACKNSDSTFNPASLAPLAALAAGLGGSGTSAPAAAATDPTVTTPTTLASVGTPGGVATATNGQSLAGASTSGTQTASAASAPAAAAASSGSSAGTLAGSGSGSSNASSSGGLGAPGTVPITAGPKGAAAEKEQKSVNTDNLGGASGGGGGGGGSSGGGRGDAALDFASMMKKKAAAKEVGGMSVKAVDGITGPLGASILKKVSKQYLLQRHNMIHDPNDM